MKIQWFIALIFVAVLFLGQFQGSAATSVSRLSSVGSTQASIKANCTDLPHGIFLMAGLAPRNVPDDLYNYSAFIWQGKWQVAGLSYVVPFSTSDQEAWFTLTLPDGSKSLQRYGIKSDLSLVQMDGPYTFRMTPDMVLHGEKRDTNGRVVDSIDMTVCYPYS